MVYQPLFYHLIKIKLLNNEIKNQHSAKPSKYGGAIINHDCLAIWQCLYF